MTPTLRLAALCALLLASAPAARADWSGTLKIRNDPKTPTEPDQDGTIEGSGAKLRFDSERPGMGKMGFVIDLKQHKALMIMDARHAFLTIDLDRSQGRAPLGSLRCDSEDGTACLKKIGFTKTGVETVNGKKSDKWEHDREDARGGKMHETLWVPQGVKGFAMVKQVDKWPDHSTTTDVLDFKEGAQPAALFEAPAGYTDMTGHGGPPMGPPGAHGQHP